MEPLFRVGAAGSNSTGRSLQELANGGSNTPYYRPTMRPMILTIIVIASIFANQPATSMDGDITHFHWKKRVLLVFAAEKAQPNFQSLANEISSRQADVDDRDLVVFQILESGTSRMNRSRIEPQKAASIRAQFGIGPNEFNVILVGKDGEIKMKRKDRVRLEEIFRLIDSMPMRQDEMRQKGRNF